MFGVAVSVVGFAMTDDAAAADDGKDDGVVVAAVDDEDDGGQCQIPSFQIVVRMLC